MSKSDTTTTTQKTEYPEWVENAQKALGMAGLGMVMPFMQSPQYQVAGMTEDQLMAGNLARQSARGAFDNDFSSRILGAGGGYEAAKVTGEDALELANPFYESVGRDTLNTMRREHDNNQAAVGARHAARRAMGGSGEAIERHLGNRALNENMTSTINDLKAQGYDRGMANALANAQMENEARQFNSGQGLAAAIAADNAYGNNFNRQQTALSTLLGYGDRTQAQAQRNLDIPWDSLQRGMSLIPGIGGTTTSTQPDTSPSWLQTLLGAGLAIGGMPVAGGGSLLGNMFR